MADWSINIAVRDLFRFYCKKNNISAKRITEKLIEFQYPEMPALERDAFYDDLFTIINKLRYKPKSDKQRDVTLEKLPAIFDWLVLYLKCHVPMHMEKILLIDKTILMNSVTSDIGNISESTLLTHKWMQDNDICYYARVLCPQNSMFIESSDFDLRKTFINKVGYNIDRCILFFDYYYIQPLTYSDELNDCFDPYTVFNLRISNQEDTLPMKLAIGKECNDAAWYKGCEHYLYLLGVNISIEDICIRFECQSTGKVYASKVFLTDDNDAQLVFFRNDDNLRLLFLESENSYYYLLNNLRGIKQSAVDEILSEENIDHCLVDEMMHKILLSDDLLDNVE